MASLPGKTFLALGQIRMQRGGWAQRPSFVGIIQNIHNIVGFKSNLKKAPHFISEKEKLFQFTGEK